MLDIWDVMSEPCPLERPLSDDDARCEVVEDGFALLCAPEEERSGTAELADDGTIRVVYAWHPSTEVRAACVRAGLEEARKLRDGPRT